MTAILIPAIVFFAALVQSLSGFGFALIVMPLAVVAIGLKTAAPLVAMVSLALNTINMIRYRQALDMREVLRLTLASVLGIPVGVWALVNVSEDLILRDELALERTKLANERTFLAYARTAIMLGISGISGW